MTDLMVDFITSLDGFGAAREWPGLWGMGSPDYLDWLEEDSQTEYVTLMGATTYRMFDEFAAAGEPGVEDLTRRRTLVFSRTMQEPPSWPNATLVSEDAVDSVRTLKRESELPLRTIGSLSLCRSLLAAGLVDRYRVVVFPVVNGATGYDRIYDGWPDVRLELASSRTFDGGQQLLEYVPTVLDGPPGVST
ncbi:deaminase [Aeromicrobium sp. Root236]|uniref:dihydrofolate reductase family protein n=1 Tax=Aeromicrobium sp. Root236 TaxID=1736498 RepID=UPI0006FA87A6|nr:dihydrofolate reductase family protein [Aeromicrobium sp. Root236]KRC65402.1 deaminase [Aeromicrobium sp. Root236]